MPALLLLGFEMDPVRVMTVSVLGAMLGILMMIPLRRAFIVKQHGKLIYPEGTACAEVLVAGEKGGATAKMVFVGFGIAFVYKFLTAAGKLWSGEPAAKLYAENEATGAKSGLKGGGGERRAVAGAARRRVPDRPADRLPDDGRGGPVVLRPRAAHRHLRREAERAGRRRRVWNAGRSRRTRTNPGLIRNMEPDDIRRAVPAVHRRRGGRGRRHHQHVPGAAAHHRVDRRRPARPAEPRGRGYRAATCRVPRTERDMPMTVVLCGSLGLVVILAARAAARAGLNFQGLLGAAMILLFGFLFVTVSSRLTGEVGCSSNPISGMTIATLLLVCLIFLILGRTGPVGDAHRADGGGGGVHRVLERRHHVAGPEDRAPRRGDAVETAVGDPHRRGHVGAGDRRHDAGPERRPGSHYTKKGFPANAVLKVDPKRRQPGDRTTAAEPYDGGAGRDGEPRLEGGHDRVPRRPRPRPANTTGAAARPLPRERRAATRCTAPTCRSRSEAKMMDNGDGRPEGVHRPAAAAVRQHHPGHPRRHAGVGARSSPGR